MLLPLLESFIYVSIYIAILKRLERPVIHAIQSSKKVQEAIEHRKRLIKLRRISFMVYLATITMVIASMGVCAFLKETEELGPAYFFASFTCSVLGSYMWLKRREKHNPIGMMYNLVKEDLLRASKPYVLFLRSFKKDDYTPELLLKRCTAGGSCFSEYLFTHILSMFRDCYAVGMTQEIEAPSGARRIYLSEQSWKEDIRELMECAEFIIILVDDTPSCIWEIQQSAFMLQKTIFLVDSEEKYNSARSLVSQHLALPALDMQHPIPVALCSQNGTHFTQYKFEHNKRSYNKLIKNIVEQHLHLEFKLPILKKLADSRFIRTCLIWVVFLCLNMLVDASFYEQHGRFMDDTYLAISLFCIVFLYYGLLTRTVTGIKKSIRTFMRWVLLVIISCACAHWCASYGGEFHALIRGSCWIIFLICFSFLYYRCILNRESWLRCRIRNLRKG